MVAALGRIAFANSRAATFLGTRYRRLARRRGKQKAIVATGNSVLTVIYHLLSDPDARFINLGPGDQNSASTNTAAPATSPPNSKRSPDSTSPSGTVKRSSPTKRPDTKALRQAQDNPASPDAFGLPTHHPIFESV